MAIRLLAGGAWLVLLGTAGASAQNISNETWLGQVGGTNTITINQSGRNNQAGADNTALRLNQDGNDNVLDIDQFGHRNQVGATPYDSPPTGINQVGGSNVIDVRQRTAADALDGSNVVGAIYQISSYLLQESANVLTIVQSEVDVLEGLAEAVGGNGEAGHGVGQVRQIHLGTDADAPNQAAITQTGGGAGEGNYFGALFQNGIGNTLTSLQQSRSNAIMDARQSGNGNEASLQQLGGEGNRVELLHQSGFGNQAEVSLNGSRNVVQRVFQSNADLGPGSDRNVVKVAIHGEDNGGADGAAGEFRSEAALAVSAAQANLVQIGEANDISVAISGEDNMYGVQQFGDGNGAIVSISPIVGGSANLNEVAVFQQGDDNTLNHAARGDRNVAAVRQFGAHNRLDIEQVSGSGLSDLETGNLADVHIDGDRNNSFAAATFNALATAALLEIGIDLAPGRLFQNGLGNSVIATVSGDDNGFGFHQDGAGNRAESIIVGSSNQIVVVQVGNGNISLTAQYGNGNTAVIIQ